ncbi:MAG: hypothetical protein EOO41_02745 [Methanobacteriota archaeon]|nr:MAG: hypothetical protein EOO41_02745 [Euryarchaeota archaeon]
MTRKKRRRMEAVADLEREERMVARAEASAARAAKAVRKAGGHADEAADEVAEIGGHNEQARAARAKVGGAASSASKLLQLDPEAAAAKRDLEQTAAITRASFAKSAKSKVRETAIRLGVTPGIAQRILQREAKGPKRGGPKRAGSGEAASRSAASSFDADMSVSAGAGAGRAGAGAGGSSGGRDKTRGDKPTKRLPGSFKSQKRFKRR